MQKKIMVAGSFDILHTGHIWFLKKAKKLCPGCKLIVVVARDSTIRKYKKREPIFTERERLEIVKSLKYVDEAILGNELDGKTFFDILLDIKPDILVLGYDQRVTEEKIKNWAKENGLNIDIVRLEKYSNENVITSSTQARSKVIKIYCGERS